VATTPAQRLGQVGERLALEHYARLGFHLVEQNYRTRAGELDLIVSDGTVLVFAEVKARRADGLDPLLSITPDKIRRLRRVAAEWLSARPHRGYRELRFDAVAVVIDGAGRLTALEQVEAIG
jgi:putative endonuclease